MKKFFSILIVVAVAAMSVGCCEKKSDSQELSFTQLMEQSTPEQVEAWYNGGSRLDEEYTKAHAEE